MRAKKRLIFTLLYCEGFFFLSRNFRLQKVGDINWLKKNYNFYKVALQLDELVLLNVDKFGNIEKFAAALSELSKEIFAPISAGGSINGVEEAKKLLRSGADKIVVNRILFEDSMALQNLVFEYGQQCIVASIDVKLGSDNSYYIYTNHGVKTEKNYAEIIECHLSNNYIGEIYLNSIDRDGTGQGLDMRTIEVLPRQLMTPLVLVGGVGNAAHILEGLLDPRVDAVATANLFNFVGNGLEKAREYLIQEGIGLSLRKKSLDG